MLLAGNRLQTAFAQRADLGQCRGQRLATRRLDDRQGSCRRLLVAIEGCYSALGKNRVLVSRRCSAQRLAARHRHGSCRGLLLAIEGCDSALGQNRVPSGRRCSKGRWGRGDFLLMGSKQLGCLQASKC